MVRENPDNHVPNRTWSTNRLIEQARQYLDSVEGHRNECPRPSQQGWEGGCRQYSARLSPSCAEDLAFLYTELSRIYTILAEREGKE